jgi:hypothetical protein
MLRKNSIAMIISAFVTAAASADDLAVTRASANPSFVLPAAAVWISFEVKNTTDHPVPLPTRYIIELTPPVGEPFLAQQVSSTVAHLPPPYGSEPTLAPGEKRLIDFPTGPALSDSFFYDKRLWQPGAWLFRLILSDELKAGPLERVHWSELMGSGLVSTPLLVAPVIRLTVEEPVGVDAEAWKALLDLPSISMLNGPKGGVIAKQLWEKYPNSRYAPYFGMVAARYIKRTGGDDRFKIVQGIYERVIAIDRDAIFADDLRFGTAFGKALDTGVVENLASAVRKTADARAALESVIAEAKHELTRVEARNEIRKLKSPDELKAFFATSSADH